MDRTTPSPATIIHVSIQDVTLGAKMIPRLLIIEEAPSILESHLEDLHGTASRLVWERAEWRSLCPEHLRDYKADLVVPVVISADGHVAEFFGWLKKNPLPTPTLAILPNETDSELLELVSRVVDDFIIAPVRADEWCHRLRRILGSGEGDDLAGVYRRLAQEMGLAQLVGQDPSFLRMVEKIPLVARSNSPVLITGETGTGKELCARAIHYLSPRRDHPFIPVDCAALPDHLFENEVFGHARGAFTDAHRDQKGLVALAEGGTLFLDEIDSLSLGAQAKLLRFMQERTYKPLGSNRFLQARLDVVAATNHDLEAMVRAKQFRSDLFFRLSVLRLHMMPLRERRGDIALLARHFLEMACAQAGVARKTLALATIGKLTNYDWPGNVRELYNVIQSAVVFSEGAQILPRHIARPSGAMPDEPDRSSFRAARAGVLEEFERRYVEDLLRECDGNVTHAARLAKKDRRAFGRLIKRYNIQRELL